MFRSLWPEPNYVTNITKCFKPCRKFKILSHFNQNNTKIIRKFYMSINSNNIFFKYQCLKIILLIIAKSFIVHIYTIVWIAVKQLSAINF